MTTDTSRAYASGPDRQQDADRLCPDEATLRRLLGEARAQGRIATIRLSNDIVLSRPLKFKSALIDGNAYNCVVDGGSKYAIRASRNATMTELLQGSASRLEFRNVAFKSPTKLARLWSTTSGGFFDHIVLRGCTLQTFGRIFQADSGTPIIRYSTFEDIVFFDTLLAFANIGTAQYEQCTFTRVYKLVAPATIQKVAADSVPGSLNNYSLDAGTLAHPAGSRLIIGTLQADLVTAPSYAGQGFYRFVRQRTYDRISVDTTRAAAGFATLLSRSFTKQDDTTELWIEFQVASSNNTAGAVNNFRIQIDGVTVPGSGAGSGYDAGLLSVGNIPTGAANKVLVTGVTAGAHTITLQWSRSAGTAQIRPVTVPDSESASLVIEELQ